MASDMNVTGFMGQDKDDNLIMVGGKYFDGMCGWRLLAETDAEGNEVWTTLIQGGLDDAKAAIPSDGKFTEDDAPYPPTNGGGGSESSSQPSGDSSGTSGSSSSGSSSTGS